MRLCSPWLWQPAIRFVVGIPLQRATRCLPFSTWGWLVSPQCCCTQVGLGHNKGKRKEKTSNKRVHHFCLTFSMSFDLFYLCADWSKVSLLSAEKEGVLNCATCFWTPDDTLHWHATHSYIWSHDKIAASKAWFSIELTFWYLMWHRLNILVVIV